MSLIESISLKNISTTYCEQGHWLPVLKDVSVEAEAGQFVAVLGPSGCGKSTILKIAAGLLKPDQGSVLVGGRDLTGVPRLVGYMPQQDLLLPWKTMLENAALPLLIAGKPKNEACGQVKALLPGFGLDGFENYYPAKLSGGMRQRAALLRTLLVESGIILLDEPFAALDALTRVSMQNWLLEIWESFKRTVLFVTHSIDEAIYLSDKVYVLTKRPGRLAATFKISLARPRQKNITTSADFSALKEAVLSALD